MYVDDINLLVGKFKYYFKKAETVLYVNEDIG